MSAKPSASFFVEEPSDSRTLKTLHFEAWYFRVRRLVNVHTSLDYASIDNLAYDGAQEAYDEGQTPREYADLVVVDHHDLTWRQEPW